MTITALPTPPNPSDNPATFNTKAFALLGALPTFVTEANAMVPLTTLGDTLYGSGPGTSARLQGNTTTTKQFLTQTGTGTVSAAPSWGALANADIPAALTGKTYNALSLTAAATGFTLAGGTTSKTLTVNNTLALSGVDGSTLNIGAGGTLGNAAYLSDPAYLVSTTLVGDQTNTTPWAKLATFNSGTLQFAEAQYILAVVTSSTGSGGGQAVILSVYVRSNATNAAPDSKVYILSKTGLEQHLADDSFKIINGAWASNHELWINRRSGYSDYRVYLLARVNNGPFTETWHTNAAWQTAAPVGANVNHTSDGVMTPGKSTAKTFTSTVATGTAPMTVASTTTVSNLNADLLDGQHGSYYQNAGNLNAGTLPDARLPARLGTLAASTTDWNTAITSGYYMGYGAANAPTPSVWYIGQVVAHNHLWVTQTLWAFAGNSDADTQTWRRESSDNAGVIAWGPWTRIWQTQTELDARYAQLGSPVFTGAPRAAGGLSIGPDSDLYIYEASANALGIRYGASGAYRYAAFGVDGNVSIAGTLLPGTTTLATNLNADLLDGQHGSYYAPVNNPTFTGTITGGTGVVNLGSGQFVKDASGNVGVGTASPAGRLHSEVSGAEALVFGSATRRLYGRADSGGVSLFTGAAQTGTGWYFDAANNKLIAYTNSAVVGQFDASGNLGIGVTPSAWGSSHKALQIGSAASLFIESGVTTDVANNVYINSGGTYTYLTTAGASRHRQYNGEHRWYTAPSGTAGNPITFTQAMTLDMTGRLTVNSSNNLVSVLNGTGGSGIYQTFSDNSTVIGDIGSANQLVGGGSQSDFGVNARGARNLIFGTNNAERARIDSSGNLLIGTTTAPGSSGSSAVRKGSTGQLILVADSGGLYHQAVSNYYLVTTAGGSTSDERLKENITDIPDALAKVQALRGVNFTFIDEPLCDADKGVQLGVLAQNVEEQFPEIVITDDSGKKSVRYDRLVAPLIGAVKELADKSDEQQTQIAAMQAQLDAQNEAMQLLAARLAALEAK